MSDSGAPIFLARSFTEARNASCRLLLSAPCPEGGGGVADRWSMQAERARHRARENVEKRALFIVVAPLGSFRAARRVPGISRAAPRPRWTSTSSRVPERRKG